MQAIRVPSGGGSGPSSTLRVPKPCIKGEKACNQHPASLLASSLFATWLEWLNDCSQSYWLSPNENLWEATMPEPSTLFLFGTGLLSFGLLRGRIRRLSSSVKRKSGFNRLKFQEPIGPSASAKRRFPSAPANG